jgi:hypothetical protein
MTDPTKIIVLGDVHGSIGATSKAVLNAKALGIKKIVQCGDFGAWTHFADGIKFVDTINELCRKHGVKIYALPGNHENHDHWDWHIANSPKTYHGFTMLRSHIMLAPKVHTWDWEGKRMAIAGGAVSIDKYYRLQTETSQHDRYVKATAPDTEHYLWWPNEQLTDEEVEAFPTTKVDYLFTHDASNATPWKYRMKPDMDSVIHRQRIDAVLKKCLPEIHFHGHFHEKYDWENRVSGDHYVQTYGLECDGMWNNWGVLDLETDKFEFAPSTMKDELGASLSFAVGDNF